MGPTLAEKLLPTDLNPLEFVRCNANSMVIFYIDLNEVITVINSLKHSSPGYDGIPATLAKRVINSYIKPLTLLINLSFSVGSFPDELKLAKVIPIFKSGSSRELHNYRPISVLNTFSKIYEKIMYNKVITFLDRYNILYQNQFGFRQQHSSHHALITLVDKITKSLDHGDIVIGIFLDLKKVFDIVDHNILIKKLYYYGIRGNILKWFESYLLTESNMFISKERSQILKKYLMEFLKVLF